MVRNKKFVGEGSMESVRSSVVAACRRWQPRHVLGCVAVLVACGSAMAEAPVPDVEALRKTFVKANGQLTAVSAALDMAKKNFKSSEQAFDAAALAVEPDAADLASKAEALRQANREIALLEVRANITQALTNDARQALYDALTEKPATRKERRSQIAKAQTNSPAGERMRLSKEEEKLVSDAAGASGAVSQIQAQSGEAVELMKDGSTRALDMALAQLKASEGKPEDNVNALMALKDATAGRLAALRAEQQGDGTPALGLAVTDQVSDFVACKLDSSRRDCTDLSSTGRELVAELNRRSERSVAERDASKLAKFNVQARELSADPGQQRAAVAYLRLIDRNPNAGWSFGGEAATLTAGGDGATASMRFSLKRFDRTLENDTTLTLSAPLADEGRTHLLSSASADRPKETAARVETVLMRNLDPSTNMLGNYNQFGVFAQLSRQRFDVADKADLKADAHRDSRTAFAFGISNMFGFSAASEEDAVNAVHRVGFEVRRGYKGGAESTRCPTQPEPGETTLSCVAGFFDPVEVEWKRTLNYRYRKEFGSVVAIAPAFSYEHTTKTKTYDLPVYLVQGSGDDKGKFTAGIAYRYVSTPGKDATKGWELFVSSPLSLFGP